MNNLFFIDNHTHGAYGINFNYSEYDEIKFLLKEHYKRGILGICPTLVGENNENIKKQLKIFKQIKDEQTLFPQEECYILGVHLEGTFLSPNKSGIQDKKTFQKPNIENFKNLVGECEDIIKIVTIAPEEDDGLIDYLNKNNIITQAGHCIGDDIKNCCGTTHHFNAMPSIHHRNKTIALSALNSDSIYIELIADLIHLSEDILKMVINIKPIDKIILISDSLPCAHTKNDIIFCGKQINSEGLDKNGILAGSCKTIDEICINLIEKNILTREEIEQCAFNNQIKYLKLNDQEITRLNYFK